MLALLRQKLYAAAVVVVTLIAFPVFVPAQTWREARQLTATGQIHWSIAALSVLTATIASLAVSASGLFVLVLLTLLAVIGVGHLG